MFQSCYVHHGSFDRIIIITIIDRIAATVQPPPLVIQYRRHQHDCHHCHRNNRHCRRGQGWTWLHTTQSLSPWSLSEHNHQYHCHRHRNHCHCRRGQGWAWLGTRWTVGGGSPRTRHLISFLLVINMMHSDKGNERMMKVWMMLCHQDTALVVDTMGQKACIHRSWGYGETYEWLHGHCLKFGWLLKS